jgi:hypothetical protein
MITKARKIRPSPGPRKAAREMSADEIKNVMAGLGIRKLRKKK